MLCHQGFEAPRRDPDVDVRRPAVIGPGIVALEPECAVIVSIDRCPVAVIILSVGTGKPEFNLCAADG